MYTFKRYGETNLNIAEQSLNVNKIDVRVESERAYIADISDIHVGNIYHNREAFEKFISQVKTIDNLYLIIGGKDRKSVV